MVQNNAGKMNNIINKKLNELFYDSKLKLTRKRTFCGLPN